MKRLKKLLLFPVCFMIIVTFNGCSKDFLNQINTTDPTEESLFHTSGDLVQLVNGIYDTFDSDDFQIKALWYQANFLTLDYRNWGSDVFYNTFEVPTNFAALDVFWVRSYQGIARANSLLDIIDQKIADGIVDQELGNRLKGEAYFLRGVFYYYLGAVFGGVPLELATVTDDGRHPRNTQDEVFQSVANDMKSAKDLLSWREDMDQAELGRATKGAAIAYLGEALMWIKKYDEAVDAFQLLEGHYALEENYLDIHDFNNQNGKESIFSIQFIEGTNMDWGRANDTQWLTTFCLPEEISQTGYAYVDPSFYHSFEAGDKRKLATVLGPGDVHPDPKIQISSYQLVQQNWGGINTLGTIEHPWKGGDGLRSGYYSTKSWRDPGVTGNVGNPPHIFSSLNLILERYGQVLLSKAESLYRIGQEGEAWNILNNQIRHRAGLGPVDESGDFIKALTKEYRHETGGEFSTFFNFRRLGDGAATQIIKENYGVTIPPGHELLPIPVNQISVNQTLVPNPGY